MIDDLSKRANIEEVYGDVCVVGAGAAGLTVASSLQKAGKRVIVVESGDLKEDASAAALKPGRVEGIEHDGLTAGRRFMFGGTTSAWAGQCVRFDSTDFADRSYLPFRGWPLAKNDIAPYYHLAERTLKIEGLEWAETGWSQVGLRDPFVNVSGLSSRGTVYTPTPSFPRLRKDLIRSRSTRVILGATAMEIALVDTDGPVQGVHCVGSDRRTFMVRAPNVVLCGGAIENARLLLLSRRFRSAGLGNENDHVGRYFQEHPNLCAADLRLRGGRLQDLFQSVYFARRKWWPKVGPSADWQAANQTMQGICNVMFEYPVGRGVDSTKQLYRSFKGPRQSSDLFRAAGAVVLDLPSVLETVHRRFRHGLSPNSPPSRAWLQVSSEQAPDRSSRVRLDASDRDHLNRPVANVDWKLNDLDFRTAREISRLVGTTLEQNGFADVAFAPWIDADLAQYQAAVSPGYHHAGTTRMSDDPRLGVVDSNCEVHSVRGLFICGGSVFPTSGWANPTLTIVALAHRLAEFLNDRTSRHPHPHPHPHPHARAIGVRGRSGTSCCNLSITGW